MSPRRVPVCRIVCTVVTVNEATRWLRCVMCSLLTPTWQIAVHPEQKKGNHTSQLVSQTGTLWFCTQIRMCTFTYVCAWLCTRCGFYEWVSQKGRTLLCQCLMLIYCLTPTLAASSVIILVAEQSSGFGPTSYCCYMALVCSSPSPAIFNTNGWGGGYDTLSLWVTHHISLHIFLCNEWLEMNALSSYWENAITVKSIRSLGMVKN